jgi:hypothetical protein
MGIEFEGRRFTFGDDAPAIKPPHRFYLRTDSGFDCRVSENEGRQLLEYLQWRLDKVPPKTPANEGTTDAAADAAGEVEGHPV